MARLPQISPATERILTLVALFVCVGFYAINVAHYVDKPLRIEETEWPPMGRAVHDNGKPVIYEGQDHRLKLTDEFTPAGGDYNGLWHPPLYQHAMAAFMVVAGTDAGESLRLIGALGLLACCALLLLICRELWPERWLRVGGAAACLLLLHPYAIQGSLFLDIDTSIYPATFLLFVLAAIRLDREPGLRAGPLLAVAAAFALILWTKLPTALVLIPVAGLYWLLRYGLVRGLVTAVAGLVGGIALFMGTYGIYIAATGQSYWYTFEFTLVQKGSSRLAWKQDWTVLRNAVDWHIAWFMPALLVVVAIAAATGVWQAVRRRRVEPLDLIWALGVAILLSYAVVSPNGTVYQGKYALPALPLLVLTAAGFLLGRDAPLPRRGPIAIAVALGVVAAALMPDLLTDQHYLMLQAPSKAAVLLGSALVVGVAVLLGGRRPMVPAAAIAVLALLFAAQSVRSFRANVSPMYPATDTADFEASVDVVNRHLGENEIAVVSKDLGFYVDGTVIEGEDIWLTKGDEFEASAIRGGDRITVIAKNTFGPPLGGLTLAAIQQCFTEMPMGKASVYLRKPRCER